MYVFYDLASEVTLLIISATFYTLGESPNNSLHSQRRELSSTFLREDYQIMYGHILKSLHLAAWFF